MKEKKNEVMLPIEGRNLVNLSNSILKTMNITPQKDTLKELDKELDKKEYKNIVLILYDGMGSSILDRYLPKESFLQQNKMCNISSIFPASTVAATTSILTGLEPSEHGWLGWDMFFKDDNETISLFRNVIKDTNIPSKHIVKERQDMKYKTILERINEETSNDAYLVWAFDEENPCINLEEINERICELCNKPNKKFIYAYYNNPDKIMHEMGLESTNVKQEMMKINDMTEKLYRESSSDTLIIVTSDHGHIECKYRTLSENKELFNMLERTTSIEPRACVMKIKKDMDKQHFEKLFLQEYGEDFRLYSREEIIKEKLFGKELKHKIAQDNIGDYMAVGIKNSCLNYDENGKTFKTCHAGITKEEMEIPLIILRK